MPQFTSLEWCAAHWLIEQQDPNFSEQQSLEFARWLASPAHLKAFCKVLRADLKVELLRRRLSSSDAPSREEIGLATTQLLQTLYGGMPVGMLLLWEDPAGKVFATTNIQDRSAILTTLYGLTLQEQSGFPLWEDMLQ